MQTALEYQRSPCCQCRSRREREFECGIGGALAVNAGQVDVSQLHHQRARATIVEHVPVERRVVRLWIVEVVDDAVVGDCLGGRRAVLELDAHGNLAVQRIALLRDVQDSGALALLLVPVPVSDRALLGAFWLVLRTVSVAVSDLGGRRSKLHVQLCRCPCFYGQGRPFRRVEEQVIHSQRRKEGVPSASILHR